MNLGLPEMFFLFAMGLLLFGPRKLPEIGRKLGKTFAEFKRASNEFQSQLNDEVRKLEDEETAQKSIAPAPPSGTAARGTEAEDQPDGPDPKSGKPYG
ncbi:MAG TPA: TatA/E family twin arginine-targeting protein translocase [Terriglobales bacterium]|nr:TatA/E family twin arginine-targeting protein translocase [Terriglobales bacterium]